jgi:hypothetical protein
MKTVATTSQFERQGLVRENRIFETSDMCRLMGHAPLFIHYSLSLLGPLNLVSSTSGFDESYRILANVTQI